LDSRCCQNAEDITHKVCLITILLTLSFQIAVIHSEEVDRNAEYRQTVRQYAGELKGNLFAALEGNDVIGAISVCSQKAPQIADNISREKNWEIRRTSLRVRNAENAPDAWESKTLEAFEQRRARGEDLATMEYSELQDNLGQKVFRYMKVIPAGQLCLTCHGTQIAPDVQAKLMELYPEDQSTGFSPGEILGAFSIKQSL
jgi:hypothetical protein